jgi:hypothetical protein
VLERAGSAEAAALLRRGGRRRAHAVLEAALARLAGAPDGNGLAWFRNAGL